MAGLLATSRGIKKVYNRKPIYSICPIAAVKKVYKRGASTSSQHQVAGEKEGGLKEGENGKIIYNITCPYLPVK